MTISIPVLFATLFSFLILGFMAGILWGQASMREILDIYKDELKIYRENSSPLYISKDHWKNKCAKLSWILSPIKFPPGLGCDEKRDYVAGIVKRSVQN